MGKIAIAASLFAVGCMGQADTRSDVETEASDGQIDNATATKATTVGGAFTVVGLTADTPGFDNLDTAMVNPWGLVAFDQMFWVTYNATGLVSTIDGKGMSATSALPSGSIMLEEGITGIAATGVSPRETELFQMHSAGVCKPALLIVASETGKLWGVNPEVSAKNGVVVVDRSADSAIYKGVTVLQRAHNKGGPLILAADFHNARIDVFDASFTLVTKISFEARKLPDGFAPFNVAAIDDTVYVTYAKQDADKEDDVPGAGFGFVAAFRSNGQIRKLVTGNELNAPWGIEPARSFGSLSRVLLVGNFGDGHITVLDPNSLKIRGQLGDQGGNPIAIDGLWGLSLAHGVSQARPDALYFASGPDDESHGLFGMIVPGHGCVEDGCTGR